MMIIRVLAALSSLSIVASAACGSASCATAGACPTDAPTATKFGRGSYAWADTMVNWTCVFSIKDFPGTPDEAFASAQAAAVSAGGGVVFFPAGSYAFASNLSLASNVVIRGVPDTRPAKSGKAPGTLAPTSVFSCPNRAHQGVWNFDPRSTNLGIVNIFLDQCAVMLWPGLQTHSFSPMQSAWWFSASDVTGMGSNKLVLGNVVRDVSLGQSLLGKRGNVYPYVFGIAVGVYTDRNAIVANNLLPASARDERTTITLDTGNITVPYMYDNRYGIVSVPTRRPAAALGRNSLRRRRRLLPRARVAARLASLPHALGREHNPPRRRGQRLLQRAGLKVRHPQRLCRAVPQLRSLEFSERHCYS